MTEPQLPIEYWDSWLVARNKINNSWTKLLEDVEAFRPSIWENWNWYIWTTDTWIHAEWYTTSFRVDSWYIQYKEENSNVWNNLIAVADLKWDTGNWIESVTATKNWKITTITIEFTEDESPYTFQISDGADWQDGRDWTDWQDWQDWQDGADWNGIAGITTNKVWKITTVTVSYTDGSDPDSFEISDWADGQDGTDGTDGVGISDISTSKYWKITTITISYTDGSTPKTFQISDGQDGRDGTDWEDWQDGVDWNGIASVNSSKTWKVTTVTISFTDGTTPPFSFTVTDWEDWEWSWDVLWPSSSWDENIVVFDWVSWKLIKDSWKKVPTKVSDLTNDSWFQTQQQVSSAISTATANFITKSVSDLTNYYLKSETYTQTEVNNLIWAIQQFHYEIFPNLQSVTTPASNVLYLIWPKWSGSDLYEEYVYTTQFVKIWETSIDLSQYVTITALNTALASYVTSTWLATILNDYVTTSGLSTTLADYVTNSSLATTLNDYATTTALNQALAGKADASDLDTLEDTVSNLSAEVNWKQDELISWTNIKTINGNDLLGSWDIEISWWSDYSWVTKTPWASYQTMQWPCAEWFHIPTSAEFTTLNSIWETLWAWDSSWAVNFSTYLKIPMNWWLNEANWTPANQWYRISLRSSVHWESGKGITFFTDTTTIYLNLESLINRWCNIRPFKDIPVVPDSSWTVLYQGTWTAWIYHNSTLGLISLSSDWTTWITIADKNLWATSVYNYWDTLSEANCWYYYQRGNNYWFARSWATSTTATKVDASSYWPWNYYNSSTFIIWANDSQKWDTSDNANLRWWTTLWLEISLRTIVNIPSSDFLLTAPATLSEWEEYVIRIISEDNYTMTLGTGFTNPWNVDTSLSFYATDQFVFLAVWWELELQPLVATWE